MISTVSTRGIFTERDLNADKTNDPRRSMSALLMFVSNLTANDEEISVFEYCISYTKLHLLQPIYTAQNRS